MTRAAASQSNFDSQRREIFASRPLAIAYLDTVNRIDGLLIEAKASKGGNIKIEQGEVSAGLGIAGNAVEAVSSIAGAFISAVSKLAGFFHQKKIKNTHANALDVAGDATDKDWSIFARELAANIVLQNQAYFKEGVHLDESVAPHRKSAVNVEDRAKIEKKSKEVFGKVVKAINSDAIEVNPEFGIADEKSRTGLIEQLSDAARTPTKQELAKEAMDHEEAGNNNHKNFGYFTGNVINRAQSSQAPAAKVH